jgi:hypothetical protein
MKRNILRINDRVMIIRPDVFIRAGYPLNKEIAKKTLVTNQEKQKLCEIVGMNYCPEKDAPNDAGLFSSYVDFQAQHAYDEMLDALAYLKLKREGFGGVERRIFTENRSNLLHKTGYIICRKVVNTGFYNNGYYDEDGGGPPYLSCMKAHVIFTVSLDSGGLIGGDIIQIENTNLEKTT